MKNTILLVLSMVVVANMHCHHPANLIQTTASVDSSKELVFLIRVNNITDSIILAEPFLGIECGPSWTGYERVWLIDEASHDTLPLSFADCDIVIDPDTDVIPELKIKPNESHTYRINFSHLAPYISPGKYKMIIKLRGWGLQDTIFTEQLQIKEGLNYPKLWDRRFRASEILSCLDRLGYLETEGEPFLMQYCRFIEQINQDLEKVHFFDQVNSDEFNFSKRDQARMMRFADNLLRCKEVKAQDKKNKQKIISDANYFYKKLEKKFSKEIPGFKEFYN